MSGASHAADAIGHVHGANIGAVRRHTYPTDPAQDARKPFISGYTNALPPDLWDRGAEPRASSTPA